MSLRVFFKNITFFGLDFQRYNQTKLNTIVVSEYNFLHTVL